MPNHANVKTTISPKPGRPLQMTELERRTRIVNAAKSAFFAHGFAATTVENIATSCGMSKKSFYRYFPNKMAVFEQILSTMPGPTYPKMPDDLAQIQEWVEVLLLRFVSHVLDDQQVALTRLVISEASNSPEIANAFYHSHLEPARKALVGAFTLMQTKGIFPNYEPEILSEILVGSSLGPQHLQTLISQKPLTSRDLKKIRKRIEIVTQSLWKYSG